MGDGQHCSCDSCGFEFFSGHSHHEGAGDAVCTHCDARYCLPTKSSMGPDFDELVELHSTRAEPVKHRGRKKSLLLHKKVREPTGQHVLAVRIEFEGRPYPGVAFAGVDELECTACRSRGGIVLDFNQGDACPRCKTGKLKCDEVVY
jgi:hypothetical protein